ncbi:hypothetical protein Unana1_02204 [Umbelopsis nana]
MKLFNTSFLFLAAAVLSASAFPAYPKIRQLVNVIQVAVIGNASTISSNSSQTAELTPMIHDIYQNWPEEDYDENVDGEAAIGATKSGHGSMGDSKNKHAYHAQEDEDCDDEEGSEGNNDSNAHGHGEDNEGSSGSEGSASLDHSGGSYSPSSGRQTPLANGTQSTGGSTSVFTAIGYAPPTSVKSSSVSGSMRSTSTVRLTVTLSSSTAFPRLASSANITDSITSSASSFSAQYIATFLAAASALMVLTQ